MAELTTNIDGSVHGEFSQNISERLSKMAPLLHGTNHFLVMIKPFFHSRDIVDGLSVNPLTVVLDGKCTIRLTVELVLNAYGVQL